MPSFVSIAQSVSHCFRSELAVTEQCAYPTKIPRINYVDFETSISERHGIVCENWPLPNFCAPGSLNSLTELEILYHAWSTGVTTFRKMSPDEHRQFKEARVQHRLQVAIAQANAAAANLAAHQQATAAQSPNTGQTAGSIQQGMPPVNGPGAVSEAPSQDHHPTTVNPMTLMYPPGREQSSVPNSAHSTSSTMEVDAQLSPASTAPSAPYPEHPPIASSSAVTLDAFGSVQPSNGSSTFVFSTGKRPPPSQWNILGPMGLTPKKPRKKRADAGVKRGPNKRTSTKNAGGEGVEASEGQEEAGQEGQGQEKPLEAGQGAPSQQQPAARSHQPSQPPQHPQRYIMPDPGGSTSVFRVQPLPKPLVLSPNGPQTGQQGPAQTNGTSDSTK